MAKKCKPNWKDLPKEVADLKEQIEQCCEQPSEQTTINGKSGDVVIEAGEGINIDNSGDGIVISSTVVPEQYFVEITEGSNTGYGTKYRADNPNNYGDIGADAIDLGFSTSASTTRGATGQRSTVSGGQNNTASGGRSTVSGGDGNVASAGVSTVSGGISNTASSGYSTVSGGSGNTASGLFSTVSGGQSNIAYNTDSTIGGGWGNRASADRSTIGGGWNNIVSGENSTVSGGRGNTASGNTSTVSGGDGNTASGSQSTVSGGQDNTASNLVSTVSGGNANTASGQYSTVSGGQGNTANSYMSWFGGRFSTLFTGQSTNSWVPTDILFNIGNGTSNVLRSNALSLFKNGRLELPSYGDGTFTGTATKLLAVDADGKVIEEDLPTSGQIVKQVKVTVTPEQMLDLASNPVELIPAQGANTQINILSIMGYLDYGTTPFNFSGDIIIKQNVYEGFIIVPTVINATNPTYFRPSASTNGIVPTWGSDNNPITLEASDDATQGDSPVTFVIDYTVHNYN